MKLTLPNPNRFSFAIIAVFAFVLFALPAKTLAASAYVSPAQGVIFQATPMISVFVETTSTEPQVSGAKIILTYPASLSVDTINIGDFDNYLEKADDPALRKITINATNNAGNNKTGRIKVASISFRTIATTGDVQLTIDGTNSSVTGAGGEQLLTEQINGVYTLNISGTTTPDTTTAPPATTPTVPSTGTNDTLLYLMLGASLLALGVLALRSPLGIARRQ